MSHCALPLLRLCVLMHRFSVAPIDLPLLSFTSLMRLFFEFSSPGDMIISSLFTWLEFSEKSFQCFVFNIPVFKSAPVLGIFSLLWQNHSEYWREGGKIYWGLEFWSQHHLPSVSHKIVEENIWPEVSILITRLHKLRWHFLIEIAVCYSLLEGKLYNKAGCNQKVAYWSLRQTRNHRNWRSLVKILNLQQLCFSFLLPYPPFLSILTKQDLVEDYSQSLGVIKSRKQPKTKMKFQEEMAVSSSQSPSLERSRDDYFWNQRSAWLWASMPLPGW